MPTSGADFRAVSAAPPAPPAASATGAPAPMAAAAPSVGGVGTTGQDFARAQARTAPSAAPSAPSAKSPSPMPPEDIGPGIPGVQPLIDFPNIYERSTKKHLQEFHEALKDFNKEGLLHKGLAALKTLGAGLGFVYAPFEAAGKAFVGRPIRRMIPKDATVLGQNVGKMVEDTAGDLASTGAMFAADPFQLAIKGVQKLGSSSVIRDVQKTLAPTSMTPESKMTEHVVREKAAGLAQSSEIVKDQLAGAQKIFASMPQAEKFAFMDAMEGNAPFASPALQGWGGALRAMMDSRVTMIQGLGRGYLNNALQDYFPHIWKNPRNPANASVINDVMVGQSKRPIKGGGHFLRQRTVNSIQDGLARGLELVSDNPLDLVAIKLREMDKFYFGTKMVDELKSQGIANFYKPSQQPYGWIRLDDPAFRVRFPTPQGLVEAGHYYAPPDAARVFNNYISEGWRGEPLYDAVRAGFQSLNQMQLSMSAFHATFVTFDTMASRVGIGIKQASRGEVFRGARNIVAGMSPHTAVGSIRRGHKLKEAYLMPGGAGVSPEMKEIVDGLVAGGGRISMDTFWNTAAAGSYRESMVNGTFLHDVMKDFGEGIMKGPLKVAGRFLQTSTAPILEWMVPRAKLGTFHRMAEEWIRTNPGYTHDQLRTAMTKIWDSVDNRLGEMVYDNVFWNKVQKDISFLLVRSVGWNLGTIRELGGGGITDTAKFLKNALDKNAAEAPEVTDRMAYAIALPIMAMTYGAIANRLMTGEAPKSMIDYFFPRTGRRNIRGWIERISIPSYIKDVLEYNRAPIDTVISKLNPGLELLNEILVKDGGNTDFYGGAIWTPGADFEKKALEFGTYLGRQMLPFPFRNMERMQKEHVPGWEQMLSFFGFNPAPAFIVHPEGQKTYELKHDIQKVKKRQIEIQRGLR